MPVSFGPPRVLLTSKAGNDPEECEDAVDLGGFDEAAGSGTVRIALSDGASESAFAREWATALTRAFAAAPPDLESLTEESLNEWLQSPREQWNDGVPWDRLPWHGEAKARAGAFATLLGLTIRPSPDESGESGFRALAVGDSCLFLIRDGQLHSSFPLERASQFDNTPPLVRSKSGDAADLWQAARQCEGECAAGDIFLLASDALANWLLGGVEEGRETWRELLALDPDGWEDWVAQRRDAGALGNDDTTLAIVEID